MARAMEQSEESSFLELETTNRSRDTKISAVTEKDDECDD